MDFSISPYVWTRKADMPVGVSFSHSANVNPANSTVYVQGGEDVNGAHPDVIMKYHTLNGKFC